MWATAVMSLASAWATTALAEAQQPLGGGAMEWPSEMLGAKEQFPFESLPTMSSNASTHPWSEPPQCLTVAELEEPLCVFVQRSFGRGRGVAVVTTPSQAALFAERAVFASDDAAELAPGTNEPQHEAILREETFAHAGRGMVARHELVVGTPLYAYTPVLILHASVPTIARATAHALRWSAVQALPAGAQAVFWDMTANAGDADKAADETDPIESRISANAFMLALHGANYFVVNPEIARMNHDCRPNAISSFDEASLTQRADVIRAVRPGEQVTVTYCDITQDAATRRQRLRHFGFTCACAACSAPPALRAESDARLAEIRALMTAFAGEHFGQLDAHLPALRAVHMAERLVLLLELERAESTIAVGLMHLAMAHASACHYDLAMAHGRRAMLYAILMWGEDASLTRGFRKFLDDVTGHWLWAWRVDEDVAASAQCLEATDGHQPSGTS